MIPSKFNSADIATKNIILEEIPSSPEFLFYFNKPWPKLKMDNNFSNIIDTYSPVSNYKGTYNERGAWEILPILISRTPINVVTLHNKDVKKSITRVLNFESDSNLVENFSTIKKNKNSQNITEIKKFK